MNLQVREQIAWVRVVLGDLADYAYRVLNSAGSSGVVERRDGDADRARPYPVGRVGDDPEGATMITTLRRRGGPEFR